MDIEPPSFSLGIDLGDVESQLPSEAPDSSIRDRSDALLPERQSPSPVADPFPDSALDPPPTFRRLRRGPPKKTEKAPSPNRESDFASDVVDDDIEEFSAEELGGRPDEPPAAQPYSSCSSIKFSLQGRGIVTKEPAKAPCSKRKQDFDAPSTSSVAERHKSIFSDLTVSPLRRFQLLDSDSDMSDSGDAGTNSSGIKIMNQRESNRSRCATTGGKRSDASANLSQKVDFWKDFHPIKPVAVPTPALDDFCTEYFKATKEKKPGPTSVTKSCRTQRGTQRTPKGNENLNQVDPERALPPVHRYFFHDDLRVQGLVRDRLCHFQPLFAANNAGNQQPDSSVIDYRGQFNHETSTQHKKGTTPTPKRGSRKAGNSSKLSGSKKATSTSEDWVSPKSGGSVPKDASKRRVHANSGSVGHWFTDENGRKVYVSKSGQELSGQMAYRCYKKESGGGFRKSKKQAGKKK